jgi:hypothetical protein
MPDVMLQDPSFEVKFVGRLVQTQRQSEVNNIMNAIAITGQIAQLNPEVLDKVDADEAIEKVFDISSVSTLLRSDNEVAQIRQQRAEAIQQQQLIMSMQEGANIAKTVAESEKDAKDSKK